MAEHLQRVPFGAQLFLETRIDLLGLGVNGGDVLPGGGHQRGKGQVVLACQPRMGLLHFLVDLLRLFREPVGLALLCQDHGSKNGLLAAEEGFELRILALEPVKIARGIVRKRHLAAHKKLVRAAEIGENAGSAFQQLFALLYSLHIGRTAGGKIDPRTGKIHFRELHLVA